MVSNKILKIEDAIKISNILTEYGYNDFGLVINTTIHSKELLNKLNQDFYYRDKANKNSGNIEPVDEIILNISGITFKYVADIEK